LGYHLKKVFSDSELEEKSVIQFFRITAADGKTYDTQHYNLSAIIAVGYRLCFYDTVAADCGMRFSSVA